MMGGTGQKVNIVDIIISLILYQKALLIYQGSIAKVHDVCIFHYH